MEFYTFNNLFLYISLSTPMWKARREDKNGKYNHYITNIKCHYNTPQRLQLTLMLYTVTQYYNNKYTNWKGL